ncbi:hypothetical protein [Halothiobacillus sp.]|uniref:hypothetical protein n=1 Tax=Halothiobacillus sp. TaxID=1891311 RepID=UPI00262614F1|nr:hypothetical protein [Halothiobacillus sp.]MDD4967784.1 hypothetical protein [Halothiobacillus sp.]
MRHTIAVVVMLFILTVGLVMPATAGFSFAPTFLFAIRDGQVETHYLVRFVGAESGELAPTGNVLRPLPGEEVVCQVLQVHAGVRLRDFSFRFARVAIPESEDWVSFALDEAYGHIGRLGCFQPVPNDLATPLRFRLHVEDGKSHEVRIFGFKEPIINGLMSLLGLSKDDLVEYSLLYVVPRESKPEVVAPTAAVTTVIDGSQFADAEATTENFRRAAEALAAVQGQVAQAVERLNLNDVALAEGIQANGMAIAELEARVAATETWIRSVEGRQVLVPPTAKTSSQHSVSAERCDFRINLPPGVVTRVETLDERGSRVYDRRYAGYIPMNNYPEGLTFCLRLTWEGASAPDPWKVVRSVRPNMVVNYTNMEVR